jgi:hypothetical protein
VKQLRPQNLHPSNLLKQANLDPYHLFHNQNLTLHRHCYYPGQSCNHRYQIHHPQDHRTGSLCVVSLLLLLHEVPVPPDTSALS